MLCREIIQVIEASYPREAALDFDNVGLLAGRAEKEVNRIYLALDATDHVIDSAEKAGADMLITHHPLIFSPVKKVTDEDFTGRRLLRLIRSDISYYAMHTNYDVLGMAELSERILDIRDARVLDVTSSDGGKEQGIGRIGNLEKPMTLSECCAHVRHSLKLGSLKVFGDMERIVYRIAVSPGAGRRGHPGPLPPRSAAGVRTGGGGPLWAGGALCGKALLGAGGDRPGQHRDICALTGRYGAGSGA